MICNTKSDNYEKTPVTTKKKKNCHPPPKKKKKKQVHGSYLPKPILSPKTHLPGSIDGVAGVRPWKAQCSPPFWDFKSRKTIQKPAVVDHLLRSHGRKKHLNKKNSSRHCFNSLGSLRCWSFESQGMDFTDHILKLKTCKKRPQQVLPGGPSRLKLASKKQKSGK